MMGVKLPVIWSLVKCFLTQSVSRIPLMRYR
jgi:hypothetical protein